MDEGEVLENQKEIKVRFCAQVHKIIVSPRIGLNALYGETAGQYCY